MKWGVTWTRWKCYFRPNRWEELRWWEEHFKELFNHATAPNAVFSPPDTPAEEPYPCEFDPLYLDEEEECATFQQLCDNRDQDHDCSLSVVTLTSLPREQMQPLRHAPHRLGPPNQTARRTSIAVFSLKRDSFPAVISLFLLLAGSIENHSCNSLNISTLIWDSCQQPIRTAPRAMACGATNCPSPAHSTRRCNGKAGLPAASPIKPPR